MIEIIKYIVIILSIKLDVNCFYFIPFKTRDFLPVKTTIP